MSRIKVTHVVEIEKEAHYFNNLVDSISKEEFEFSFVNFFGEGSFTESLRSRNHRVYSLNVTSKAALPRAAGNLWKILRVENPDLVHTHLFNPTLIGLLCAKLQKRKTMLTRHHSDAVHLLPGKLKRSIYLAMERMNNRNADHIIAPSQTVRQCLVEWEEVPDEKVSIIPYGQTSKRYDAVTPESIEAKRMELGMNDRLSLVCVSRLYHGKGHKYLFEAASSLIRDGLDTKVYLVGDGEYRDHLVSLAKKLGVIENIEFLGWRDDILEIIGAADIIVHPSLEDALSQSLIESLMLARPIIATDISGASDILDGGKYGCLVPPADSKRFGQALKKTIDNLEDARFRARQGRDFILEYMDARRVAGEYARLYKQVIGAIG